MKKGYRCKFILNQYAKKAISCIYIRKNRSFMLENLDQIIDKCRYNDALAQRQLYDYYKSTFFGICRRYISNYEDAEDVLVETFVKIFSKIDDYKGDGSFEGWMKRITVNESLMFLRKHKLKFDELDVNINFASETPQYEEELEGIAILNLLDQLPDGYRTVLNMYAIEGYKHKEIAEILGISINTSKSQLILARKKMQDLIQKSKEITTKSYYKS
jgi:RNA polymerase sigma factor (sigma-70 family)